jgi:hypothetical protein
MATINEAKYELSGFDADRRFWPRVGAPDHQGCRRWTAGHVAIGYGVVTFRKKLLYVHRVAWILSKGPIPSGLLVCHRCDVRDCCEVRHHFLGDYTDNNRDRDRKGRGRDSAGEAHPRAVLTEEIVRDIRLRVLRGEKQIRLAKEYGLSRQHVSYIVLGKRWASTFKK